MSQMIAILEQLQPWMWFVAALVLIGLEITAPGLFMLWLGLAAGLTGVVGSLLDVSWQAQMILFAISAVVLVVIGRNVMRRQKPTDAPFLNQRGEALVGRELTLIEAISGGFGRVRIDDTVWRVSGNDTAMGAKVKVTGLDGSTLRVIAL